MKSYFHSNTRLFTGGEEGAGVGASSSFNFGDDGKSERTHQPAPRPKCDSRPSKQGARIQLERKASCSREIQKIGSGICSGAVVAEVVPIATYW